MLKVFRIEGPALGLNRRREDRGIPDRNGKPRVEVQRGAYDVRIEGHTLEGVEDSKPDRYHLWFEIKFADEVRRKFEGYLAGDRSGSLIGDRQKQLPRSPLLFRITGVDRIEEHVRVNERLIFHGLRID